MTTYPHDLLGELLSADRHEREHSAAYLGDWLASAHADQDTGHVVTALVDALIAGTDPDGQEEIANALGYLAENGQAIPETVQPLRYHLPRLHHRAAEHVTDLMEASS